MAGHGPGTLARMEFDLKCLRILGDASSTLFLEFLDPSELVTIDTAGIENKTRGVRQGHRFSAEIDQFLEHRLRHHVMSDESLFQHSEVSSWVKKVYSALVELRTKAGSQKALDSLDEVRVELDHASDALGALVWPEDIVDYERAAGPLAAQAKLLACDVAVEVTQLGQLLHGGWGYAEEYPISRYVVDAQVLPIFEGVKPILELKVIARSLLAS